MTEETDPNARHNEKMAKKKAARDKILATKTIEKGLIIVHTGKGKGKSTAAMGLAARAIGNGMKVGIVQFVKGVWETGERKVLEAFPDLCVMQAMGEGFTWETQDRARDVAAAEQGWRMAQDMMNDPSFKMVILDELNIVLRYDYIALEGVLKVLQEKRPDLHVVITGRNAKEELIEAADLVTDMTQVKHPFRSGVKAQVGVEF
ncbi:MAG: cob(I)yrinic acid a,c-diamide adenosyltransferase [Rhodospirillales bacterium]|nr:cob(I)yrinic acid a,c-diamide adenosyltransferase [Rhodospirillales bacterium]